MKTAKTAQSVTLNPQRMGLDVKYCDSETCIDMAGMNRLFGAHFNRLRSILTIVIDVAVKGAKFGELTRKNKTGCGCEQGKLDPTHPMRPGIPRFHQEFLKKSKNPRAQERRNSVINGDYESSFKRVFHSETCSATSFGAVEPTLWNALIAFSTPNTS